MIAIDLGGAWTLIREGTSESISAHVPGCVHTDLLAAGMIDDPFYRDNETRLSWIGEANWVYSRTFQVPQEALDHDRVLLHCDGLDTLATIIVNGICVARVDNMFRTWEFDVKGLLHSGENCIGIRFESPIPYLNTQEEKRQLPSWSRPPDIPGRAWIRKEPCNFGWDWGPVLVTCGIWRSLRLVAFNTARIADVTIQQRHVPSGTVELDLSLSLDAISAKKVSANITVSLRNEKVTHANVIFQKKSAKTSLLITDPQLWWPNDMGKQPLYEIHIELCDTNGSMLDLWKRRVGLRTLRLARNADTWGESFQFVVNGIPFFAKGANWIPADVFSTRTTLDRYHHLLHSAAEAHMNMLRVWGGGIYEDDRFYDLCDELGICVWQDFIFACSTYPAFDNVFMKNVRIEAEENIKRLRHHPSLAFWCGNNELEFGLVGDVWTKDQMSWSDYKKLFDNLLANIVSEYDPERDYWPGTPHSPQGNRQDSCSPSCGDAHLWDVWFKRQPFESYRSCHHRFVSEFGFQSFPEPRTVQEYTVPDDRNIASHVMEHHQRSPIGNSAIVSYMLDWFRLPLDFDTLLWLSQILQGTAMKYAVERWRRNMPCTMGTLYWQLNDCWPVASWSSIDSNGRWKALQYLAKRFYAPVLVSGVEDPQTGLVELHVTNDQLTGCTGQLSWVLTDIEGRQLALGTQSVDSPPQQNLLVGTLHFEQYLVDPGMRNLMLWLELSVDDEVISKNFISFARPKHLDLADPDIIYRIDEIDTNIFQIILEAAKPALWVWLELGHTDARFSDNFFHLMPGKPEVITVAPAAPLSLVAFEDELHVRSLLDTYLANRSTVRALELSL